MGLFDRFKPKAQSGLSLEEAIAAIILGAVAVDGDISSQELVSCNAICARMPLFRDMSQTALERLFKQVGGMFESKDIEELLQAATSVVPDELRLPVFLNAVDIVFADGEVGEEEQDFVAFLVERFGIDEDTAGTAIDVLRQKNFG